MSEARPVYLGPKRPHYGCPFCPRTFINYRPCAMHAGLVVNMKASCIAMTKGTIQKWGDVSDALLHTSQIFTGACTPIGTYEYDNIGPRIVRVKIVFDLIPDPTKFPLGHPEITDDDIPF